MTTRFLHIDDAELIEFVEQAMRGNIAIPQDAVVLECEGNEEAAMNAVTEILHHRLPVPSKSCNDREQLKRTLSREMGRLGGHVCFEWSARTCEIALKKLQEFLAGEAKIRGTAGAYALDCRDVSRAFTALHRVLSIVANDDSRRMVVIRFH